MRYVRRVTDEEKTLLEDMKKHHPRFQNRNRAHAILLSNEGMAVQELSRIFSVCRQTATKWLDSWGQQGLNALSDKPRSGRPPKDSKAKKDKSI